MLPVTNRVTSEPFVLEACTIVELELILEGDDDGEGDGVDLLGVALGLGEPVALVVVEGGRFPAGADVGTGGGEVEVGIGSEASEISSLTLATSICCCPEPWFHQSSPIPDSKQIWCVLSVNSC